MSFPPNFEAMRGDRPAFNLERDQDVALKPARFPKLIYLPGMDGTGDLFYRQTTRLSTSFEVQPFTFNGLVKPSWEQLVTTVVNQHLQEEPAILCGESFGGCLALTLASLFPHLVAGLILINPASAFRKVPLLNSLTSLLTLIPEGILNSTAAVSLNWLCNPERIHPSDLQRFQQAVESVSKADTLHRLQLLRQFEMNLPALKTLNGPILLIASQKDRLLPSEREANHLQTYLPSAQLELLPNSGHACLLEKDLHLIAMLEKYGWCAPPFAPGKNLR